MKRKKVVFKIIIATITAIVFFNIINFTNIYAADISLEKIENKAENFISEGATDIKITEDDAIDMFVPVGQILVFMGNAAVVVAVAMIGAKWIIAKPDQQAKLKQQLIGIVVAIFVIDGGLGIWNILKNILE